MVSNCEKEVYSIEFKCVLVVLFRN